MTNKTKIIIGVVAVAAVGIGIYLYKKNKTNNGDEASTSEPKLKPTRVNFKNKVNASAVRKAVKEAKLQQQA